MMGLFPRCGLQGKVSFGQLCGSEIAMMVKALGDLL